MVYRGGAMAADRDDIDTLKAKKICFECIGEAYLAAVVRAEGARRKCTYCGSIIKCFSIGEIAERIDEAFDSHYQRTSDQPDDMQYAMLRDRESSYDWERDGEPVVYAIMNAADIPEVAAADIQSVLEDAHGDFEMDKMGEETPFGPESHYDQREPDPSSWMREWQEFDRSLQFEARFFSKSAEQHLASVFNQLENLQTADGRPIIVGAGPKAELRQLFRARVFQDDNSLEKALKRPDLHLGPPPSRLANAGRMNARGISVFYGANSAPVALAEVRPPVGSRVAVARFEIIRPIKLLDLTAFDGVIARGSIFDAGYAGQLGRSAFLRTLSQRLARPVMPDDEAFAYLATQAVADYLATDDDMSLDGIIFPSVQAGGTARNVVLFQKAAQVEPLEIPDGTEIRASLYSFDEDGDEADYSVIESTPPPPKKIESNKSKSQFWAFGPPLLSDNAQSGWRQDTLRVDIAAIAVHKIKAVEIKSLSHRVRRHRVESRRLAADKEPDF
jgi:hypothetical protein